MAEDTTAPPEFDPDTLREKYRLERDKRIRRDGNAQYVEVAGRFAGYLHDPYTEESPAPPWPTTSGSPSSAAASPG